MAEKSISDTVDFFFKAQGATTRTCCEPSEACEQPAIRAHSLPRRAVLDRLSSDGHVVMPQMSLKITGPSQISFRRIGINKATTFAGLCSRHDNEIFRPIDDNLPDTDNLMHLFLLAYRAVLREFHVVVQNAVRFQATYQKGVELGRFPKDTPCDFGKFAASHIVNAYEYYEYKRQFDTLYLTHSWDSLVHETLFLDNQAPTIAVSSSFSLDAVPVRNTPRISLSIYPNDVGVSLVFSSTRQDAPHMHRHLQRLVSAGSHYQRYLISKLVLQSCDNFVISAEYFDGLSTDRRDALCQFYTDTILTNDELHENQLLYLF